MERAVRPEDVALPRVITSIKPAVGIPIGGLSRIQEIRLIGRTLLAVVHFQIAQANLTVLHGRTIGNGLPVRVAPFRQPVRVVLGLSLTLDAQRAVRKDIQPGNGNLGRASLAQAISALFEAKERPLDLI
jgi:hypothetical protein